MSQVEIDVIALGRVVDEGRGSLPFALVHGEALVTAATWALSAAGVLPLDARSSLEAVLDAGLPLVLHDALCPMTPPGFLESCVRRCLDEDVVVAGVQQVTDTVKVVHDGLVGDTVDRETLVRVVSPVVVPPTVVAEAAGLLGEQGPDFAALVTSLRAITTVVLADAPVAAMRVSGPDDVRVLEALTQPAP